MCLIINSVYYIQVHVRNKVWILISVTFTVLLLAVFHFTKFNFTPCSVIFIYLFLYIVPIFDVSYAKVQLNDKCDCQLSEPFIVKKPFWSGLSSVMCLWTWAPKTMNSEPPSVNCKWVLKNWHSHLGSTSYPSQTNEAPRCFKVRLISFWDSAQSTGIQNTEKGASLHGNPEREHPPPHPIFHWSDVETKTRRSFSTSSIFTHSSWILAANSRLYYWMDALLCHCEECLKWNLKLEQNNSQFLWTSVATTYIYHLMVENFSIFSVYIFGTIQPRNRSGMNVHSLPIKRSGIFCCADKTAYWTKKKKTQKTKTR